MEYYFDHLDPVSFQRLINAILVARLGEAVRLTPLRGADGGRDGETAPGNPYFEYKVGDTLEMSQGVTQPPTKGRYLFQVKHHRTSSRPPIEARHAVIADFESELKVNVLKREGIERINYFFLVTNVSSSKDAIEKIDGVRSRLLRDVPDLHADVWWQERVIAFLDQMPSVWSSFPDIFAGGQVPILAQMANQGSGGLSRAIKLAISRQYVQDQNVKFRQIELEKNLARLFVDLDIDIGSLPEETQRRLIFTNDRLTALPGDETSEASPIWLDPRFRRSMGRKALVSALSVMLDERKGITISKLVLEGGPGQGKSTLTQMAAQIYRAQILGKDDIRQEGRWLTPEKARLPFRVELRRLAEWLSNNPDSSIEEYLVNTIRVDAGGNAISVNDLQEAVEKSPVILIFDGLDEIGSDKLRDEVLLAINECVKRFENDLRTDLRVIVTTRPPALAGRGEALADFVRLSLAPMEKHRVQEYLERWLSVQDLDSEERDRIGDSFKRRQDEPHVEALARNPMQLSVLLQLIRLKGAAFPDRRAELYRDYFQIAIDRDVEKSPELRENRDVIQALHEFIGYVIHALTEVDQADRTLKRPRLIEMVGQWLRRRGDAPDMAQQFFKLGEERFGLIVATKGEGEETRYGYAIQPIQEYFAAAFICNQISPDSAHDVFEEMIHRSYWREVALFLAGLRRPNEKADLIVRADRVDRDKKLGWYQDGRAIILQLLQEGVLTEPRHVYSHALGFLLDLLDTETLRVQREPSNLLSVLDTLLKQTPVDQHKERILRYLREYRTCEDQYVMMRQFHVASRLLQPDDYFKMVLDYEGNSPSLTALIRLGWPFDWNIDIEPLSRDSLFWHGVPDHIWAQTWWLSFLHSGVAQNIQIQPTIHQRLVEQFATTSVDPFFNLRLGRPVTCVASKLAVWRMAQYQFLIEAMGVLWISEGSPDKTIQKQLASFPGSDDDVAYTGMEEPFQTMTADVIRLSRDLLVALCGNSEQTSRSLAEYVGFIREYLQHPGLASWIACRCAVALLRGTLGTEPQPTLWGSRLSESDRRCVLSLVKDIRPFYTDSHNEGFHSNGDESETSNFLVPGFGSRYLRHYRYDAGTPAAVRLETGAQPTSLIDILSDFVTKGCDIPYDWIKKMSLPIKLIRPLVERCRDHLPDLLRMVSQHDFVHSPPKPLRVQDTQRVLKIARQTNDPEILKGVAITLRSASFLRVADREVIMKLLRLDTDIQSGSLLFNRSFLLDHERDASSFTKEFGLIEEVARGVFEKPELFPFRVVCQASGFLAENSRIELPPLLHEEERLGIRWRPA